MKIKKTFALLNAILENDNKEIKEVTSITMPLDIALAKVNSMNLEDLLINPSNVFTNHSLLSNMQVREVDKIARDDFKEDIAIFQMEADCVSLKSSSKIPSTPLLPFKAVELDVSDSQHKDVALAKYKSFGTNL
jgi:hypothetical protein